MIEGSSITALVLFENNPVFVTLQVNN
jgi:hypothetical protein